MRLGAPVNWPIHSRYGGSLHKPLLAAQLRIAHRHVAIGVVVEAVGAAVIGMWWCVMRDAKGWTVGANSLECRNDDYLHRASSSRNDSTSIASIEPGHGLRTHCHQICTPGK